MFVCEKCGSRYSAMHAATMENCPRCLIRDRVSSPLAFQAFQLPNPAETELASPNGRAQEQDRSAAV